MIKDNVLFPETLAASVSTLVLFKMSPVINIGGGFHQGLHGYNHVGPTYLSDAEGPAMCSCNYPSIHTGFLAHKARIKSLSTPIRTPRRYDAIRKQKCEGGGDPFIKKQTLNNDPASHLQLFSPYTLQFFLSSIKGNGNLSLFPLFQG